MFGFTLIISLILTFGSLVIGCGTEEPPDGVTSTATITGQVFDGRTLEPRDNNGFVIGPPIPLMANIEVASIDGSTLNTLVTNSNGNATQILKTETNEDGTFEIDFEICFSALLF